MDVAYEWVTVPCADPKRRAADCQSLVFDANSMEHRGTASCVPASSARNSIFRIFQSECVACPGGGEAGILQWSDQLSHESGRDRRIHDPDRARITLQPVSLHI